MNLRKAENFFMKATVVLMLVGTLLLAAAFFGWLLQHMGLIRLPFNDELTAIGGTVALVGSMVTMMLGLTCTVLED